MESKFGVKANMEVLNTINTKLSLLSKSPLVSINQGVIISSDPSEERTCFPYPQTPPLSLLNKHDLKEKFFPATDTEPCGLVSEYVNVGSAGVCMVTTRTVSLSNAHAGCHADQPLHFCASPCIERFSDNHYNGKATVLDLSVFLNNSGKNTVTADLLCRAAEKEKVDLNNVERLLLASYNSNHGYAVPTSWDEEPMHLDKDCAKLLASAKKLVLIGLDTPSVDHPSAAPIEEHAHGHLFRGGVAILENLNFASLFADGSVKGAKNGVVQTIWNPGHSFPDARGATVLFFPAENKC